MSKVVSSHSTTIYDFCPIGAIIAFPATAIPPGWLECNGQAISRTTFTDLFGLVGTTYGVGDGSTTFNLPDYRGVFLRGKDNGKGYDVGRALGDLQQDMTGPHNHVALGNNGFINGANAGIAAASTGTGAANWGASAATANNTGTESRPKNVSVIYCIKATMAIATSASTVSTFASLTHNTHQGEVVSFGASGYKKFADGTIIQWGVHTGASGAVTFPVAFPSSCRCLTGNVLQITTGALYSVGFANISATGFTIGKCAQVGSTTATTIEAAFWLAVGS